MRGVKPKLFPATFDPRVKSVFVNAYETKVFNELLSCRNTLDFKSASFAFSWLADIFYRGKDYRMVTSAEHFL